MELYQLQTFIIVAEEGSITGAARRLYTTPSTVSMHIRALEDELGVELFTRSNQGVTITAKGQQLREKAVITLRAAQDLVNHASDMQETLMGVVAIGLCSEAPLLKIPQLVQHLQAGSPGIDLLLQKLTSAQIIEALATDQLDLGFVYGLATHPVLAAQQLMQVELVVAAPASWPQEADKQDWRSLAAGPWVSPGVSCPFQALLDEHLHRQGLSCRQRVQVDDERSRYELVKAGVGLSLLERDLAAQGAAEGVMQIMQVEPLYCELSLVWRAHERAHPLLRCVIDAVGALFARD